ncbi:DUF4007 family protein [Halanaerobium congolense]|uniref:DUF4007 domain-containing protein n=1 Tax=Halanaerobium congolense TaxID=54121 RepID=A0A1G6IUP3_9FIRM|nr:DUF4007 family protein [Halanaerobium congolense]SDC10131.1 Protein of unknown function [Halanaerobium congolense]
MDYKIQILNGYKLYFDQITNVFRSRYLMKDNINLDELTEETGLNRRKTRLLLNYLADMGLNEKRTLNKTDLGQIIFENDDFLEDLGTLWLMHYLSASNEYFVIWNRFFNYISDKSKFSVKEALNLFTDLEGEISTYSYNHHIRKELLQIMIDAYVRRRLSELGLIEKLKDEAMYYVNINNEIPERIFLAACLKFRDNFYKGATSIEIDDLVHKANSPGRIFILTGKKVRNILDKLKDKRLIGVESRGDLDQIRFPNNISFEKIISDYYENKLRRN